jgi:uncharacterized protein DUF4326
VTSIKVINRKRDGIPDGAAYVGRPTILGNPFKIGEDGTREEVIAKYETYFRERISKDERFRVAVEKLRGREILVCWCAPKPCHADVIARYLHESSDSGKKNQ